MKTVKITENQKVSQYREKRKIILHIKRKIAKIFCANFLYIEMLCVYEWKPQNNFAVFSK
ncbi:hypothetical protein [Fusibacter sp. JL216-2]|uniref:hypothetical protein n=1 Tax=Fusibacter sp. JL216-2 TaxID=3071453 RepID=UPI003D3580AC